MLALMAGGGGRSLEGDMDRVIALGEGRALDDVDIPFVRSRNSCGSTRLAGSMAKKK
jgi:hypothetical protein